MKLKKPISIEIYKNWLEQGMNADMGYLQKHLEDKEHPQLKWHPAKSLIVIAQNYIPHPSPVDSPIISSSLKIAKYAKGSDYHHWFLSQLNDLCEQLGKLFPNDSFIPATDSSPLLERNWAYESGLGWFGKNTCLINKNYGSFHFLGEIITSLDLEPKVSIHPDMCGTCTRCIDACPTSALDHQKQLDANKCISYWTIETRKVPPQNLRAQFGNWLFGCDICQDVCPWNHKAFSIKAEPAPSQKDLIKDLMWILTQSNKSLLKNLKGTPFMRTGPIGLKKNAILIAGNHQLSELNDVIKTYLDHSQLAEISKWTLAQIEKNVTL